MIIKRTTKLRMRRAVRRKRRQAEDMSFQAGEQFDKLVVRRWDHLLGVLRFVMGWAGLVIVVGAMLVFQTLHLSEYYLKAQAVPGGTYTEGILGNFTNANPLYATSLVDESVSRLIFSGLMREGTDGLVGALADSLTVDETGKIYTAHLRPQLKWHDGNEITAKDVVFTISTIQNPDAKSPLQVSWQGVRVEAPDDRTVIFTLPSPLTSFAHSLTVGILPEHLLGKLTPSALRSAAFNTVSPIGSGPFRWSTINVVGTDVETREEQITLLPFDLHQGGAPLIDAFVIRTFRTEKSLTDAFARQELTGMVGIDRLPSSQTLPAAGREYAFPLSSGVYIFLRNSQAVLSDVKVRQALTFATDTAEVQQALGYPTIPVREPFLKSHTGLYSPLQQQSAFNLNEANRLLDEAGWVKGSDGYRVKAGATLELAISSQQDTDYEKVVDEIRKEWRLAGVKATANLVEASAIDASYIATHNYDVLVYGIAIGPDPDVFAYWHSSQADISNVTHLNLSEYKSGKADAALEAGRTRSDVQLRAIKYLPFLEAWRTDAPAIGLYQPHFVYFTNQVIDGLMEGQINSPSDRYNEVEKWMITTKRVSEKQ